MAEALSVEVKVADLEPFKRFAAGVGEAAEMFAALTEDELATSPDAVVFGVARLRGALAEITGDTSSPVLPDDEPLRYGLVIEWPAPPAGGPARIHPRLVSVFELTPDGERQVLPIRVSLRLSADDIVTADVELLVGEDGEPVTVGQFPAVRDSGVVTTVRRYEVAEMRVRS